MASKIKLIFLGTSDSIPSVNKNHPSILLNYQGENILIDCGEGTQRQIRKAGLNPCRITRILITHWHGDHVLGLVGLLSTLSLSGYNKTIYIYGPNGTKENFNKMLNVFPFQKNYEIKVEEVSGKFLETDDFYLEAKKVKHRINCNAYCFVKKGYLRIDKDKLKKLKISEGPLLQKLKQGKNIVYQGKKYLAKNLTFREENKKVCFVLDTQFSKELIPFFKNSDLIVSEAMFSNDFEKDAKEKMHLTSGQAAEIAKKSNSKKLILMHISSRYDKIIDVILREARKIFKNTFLVKDFDVVEV